MTLLNATPLKLVDRKSFKLDRIVSPLWEVGHIIPSCWCNFFFIWSYRTQLKSMYDPANELLIPQIPDEHPGDSNYVRAQPNQREWNYEKDVRSEQNKFRSDVRAAYRQNGC